MSKIPEESENLSPASSKWRKSVMGLMLLALGISSVWFLNRDGDSGDTSEQIQVPNESVTVNKPKVPELSNTETAEPLPEASPSEKAGDDKPTPKASKSPAETIKKTETKLPKEEPTPRPIAGNFEPNSSWERYVDTYNRGSDFEVNLNFSQINNETKLETGQFLFNFSGSLTSKNGAVPGDFTLRFFTNKEADFKANSAFLELEIEFSETKGQYSFDLKESLNFEPGLYYFVMEDWESGERYFTGKIKVNP